MIVALAVACFTLGFGAAVLAATDDGKYNKDIAKLLSAIGLPSNISRSFTKRNATPEPSSRQVGVDNLLTKEQVENGFEKSSWQALAYQDFKDVIVAKSNGMKTFPCIYATMGYRADEHRYIFLNSDDPSEPQNVRLIAPALKEYLAISPSLGPNTSLVIVCAPSEKEKSVEDYNNTFWGMLRGLRIIDSKSWPRDVPESVESEKWTFCFGGEPVFPVMLTPAHMQRWSRHMSVPIIALQPKWVLDKLLATDQKREAATGKVRKLLKEYDQIEISPDLTSYGQPGTSEARQLCLLDKNETAGCPFDNLDR
ncbi:hypothetical protein LTS08_000457 [Lithohypha guttulata]|uniref:Uncharacterized protein n=1 Tax=Lithohypha guttulata TaxID=1690604 RepID=A0AAN7T4I9_9EURO|nr:hypothetical protein LTR05_003359 [Lithohypha guttulata]KAK5106339.1 hypothetical protein LTS08_000457 [Lithohypha guttulata]